MQSAKSLSFIPLQLNKNDLISDNKGSSCDTSITSPTPLYVKYFCFKFLIFKFV